MPEPKEYTMSVAEAIRFRADIKKQIQEQLSLMKSVAKTSPNVKIEDMTGGESFASLLEDYDFLMEDLKRVSMAISAANIDTFTGVYGSDDELTLTEAIMTRDNYAAKANAVQGIINLIAEKGYGDEEHTVNADVGYLRDYVSNYRSSARQYDNAIQKTNWKAQVTFCTWVARANSSKN